MGFNSESGKRAYQRKAGLGSWRARVQLHGMDYYIARAALMRAIQQEKRELNRNSQRLIDQVSDQSVNATSVSPDRDPENDA